MLVAYFADSMERELLVHVHPIALIALALSSVGSVPSGHAGIDGNEFCSTKQSEKQAATARKIKKLDSRVISRDDWRMAGRASPPQTLETFMWALREKNDEQLRACLGIAKGTEAKPLNFQSLENVVDAIQPMAIRTTEQVNSVELKFRWRIKGNGNIVLSHRLKLVENSWVFDLSANTHEADW